MGMGGFGYTPRNNADFIHRVFVPEGAIQQRSRALGAFGRSGGGEQFRLLHDLSADNFSPGVLFK